MRADAVAWPRSQWFGAQPFVTETIVRAIPEWRRQARVWVGWPRLADEWGEAFDGARAEIAGFVRTLSRFVPVRLAVGDAAAERAAQDAGLNAHAELCQVQTGDIWLRDTGPVFVVRGGQVTPLGFRFNGWGGKYVLEGDDGTAEDVAAAEDLALIRHEFVLEGGAVEFDGAGRVLTTRDCLLNPNRNSGWGEGDAEAALEAAFGVHEVVWLERGLLNDQTDGHIDNIARFVAPGRVVCQRPADPGDPNAERLADAEEALRAAGLDVVTLPAPPPVFDADGAAMPASHMNFLITNGAVLLPAYDEATAGAAAQGLAEVFPGREIIPLPAGQILTGGGSFHCMTCPVPARDWEDG